MLIRTQKGTLLNLAHAIEIYPAPHQPDPSNRGIDINILWVGHHEPSTYRLESHLWRWLVETHQNLEVSS